MTKSLPPLLICIVALLLPLHAFAAFSAEQLEKIDAMSTDEKVAYFATLSPAEVLAYEQIFTPAKLTNEKPAPITSLGNAQFAPIPEAGYDAKTLRRIADLALFPPVINANPGKEFAYDQLDFALTEGIERTPKGRLWSTWMAGEDGPLTYIVAACSDDNGETWSKSPRLVVNGHSRNEPFPRSNLAANFWVDPLGRLWLFFDQGMNHTDGRAGLWYSRCDNPDAENPTWSAPVRICDGHMLNEPIVLASGEWLLPTYLPERARGNMPFTGIFPELDAERGVTVYSSTDEGRTFRKRGTVNFPYHNWPEPALLEHQDGSLTLYGRTTRGIMQSTSTDKGMTWTTPIAMPGVVHPPARFVIRRLNSGNILLVKYGRTLDTFDEKIPRSQLTAWISEDDGKTWKGGLMLDERPSVSYPDSEQAPDGTIYIQYDYKRVMGDILLARVTEADILAGKLVNPNSRLQMLIYRAAPSESVHAASEAVAKARKAGEAAKEAEKKAAAKAKAAEPPKPATPAAQTSTTALDKSGDWFTSDIWDHGVPTSDLRASIVGFSKLTITSGEAEARLLNIGSSPTIPAQLTLKGGSLRVFKGFSIALAQRGNGAFIMTSGTLSADSTTLGGSEPPPAISGFLSAAITFSGGSADLGNIMINLNKKLTTTFSVEGAQAAILGEGFVAVEKETPFIPATVRFVMAAESVSPLTLSGALELGVGRVNLVVDGSGYKGGARKIPLIKAGSISGRWAEVKCTGFSGLEASVESRADNQVMLVLAVKP